MAVVVVNNRERLSIRIGHRVFTTRSEYSYETIVPGELMIMGHASWDWDDIWELTEKDIVVHMGGFEFIDDSDYMADGIVRVKEYGEQNPCFMMVDSDTDMVFRQEFL